MDSFLSLFEPTDAVAAGGAIAAATAEFSERWPQQQQQQQFISPEPQSGNIEYKLKLVNPTHKRFQHLVTQMKWRLFEGNGFAIYRIGVADNGQLKGLDPHEMAESLKTVGLIVRELNASVTEETEITVGAQRSVRELRIELRPVDREIDETRVTVIGPSDGGKSTLVSVLTHGELDNGWGRARLNMFQHRHEVKSGHTSSVAMEILGFDASGRPKNYRSSELITTEQIYSRSAKVVTFFDLAGHQRYRKTFLHGLCASYPNLLLIAISCVSDLTAIADYVEVSRALQIPFAVVLTKIDLIEADRLDVVLRDLRSLLRTSRKPIEIVHDLNRAIGFANGDDATAAGDAPDRVAGESAENEPVPVFQLSSVTGIGIDRISRFFSQLDFSVNAAAAQSTADYSINFKVNKVYRRKHLGPVVVGYLKSGRIDENAALWIGPKSNGAFETVLVRLIYRNKTRVKSVKAGQNAGISFQCWPKTGTGVAAVPAAAAAAAAADDSFSASVFDEIRPGMVLLRFKEQDNGNGNDNCDCDRNKSQPLSTTVFEVLITNNASALLPLNNPVTIFIENVRQCVSVVEQQGYAADAKVTFKFIQRPEFIQVGMKFIVCNNSKFVIGSVIRLVR